jgi:putative endonuclease
MPYYTYIIYSETSKVYYKGFTEYLALRMAEHNDGDSRYTAGKGPWKLIVLEEHASKQEAIKREKSLKKCKKDYFEWLRNQPHNLAANYPEYF